MAVGPDRMGFENLNLGRFDMERRDSFLNDLALFFGRIALIAAAVAVGIALIASGAKAASSYAFNGLQWGASTKEAMTYLRGKGFKVSKPTSGPSTEYVQMNAWLDIRKVDRGKRMKATGKYLGEKIVLDLIFGFNDRLERVHMRTPLWDGTQKGGKKMTQVADKLTAHLEDSFGRAIEKQKPYGFIDTARWTRASDGSNMEMFMRGTEGFMFYPPHKTVLNVSFWNSRYSSSPAAIASSGQNTEPYAVNQNNLEGSDR